MFPELTADMIVASFSEFYGPKPQAFQRDVIKEFISFVDDISGPVIGDFPFSSQVEILDSWISAEWPSLVLSFLAKKHGEESVQMFLSMTQTKIKEDQASN
jgi:hypothetical protein